MSHSRIPKDHSLGFLLSRGTPRSLSIPSSDTSTGRRSTCPNPYISGKILPSQCTTSGKSGANSALVDSACSFLAFFRNLRTEFRERGKEDGSQPRAAAKGIMSLTASRSDVLFRSKAPVTRWLKIWAGVVLTCCCWLLLSFEQGLVIITSYALK